MAAAVVPPYLTMEQYLQMGDLQPDVDYVDGFLEERCVGERDHSTLQRELLLLLSKPEFRGWFSAFPELRVQVSATRFRVPDVCVLRADAPYERIVHTPPLLAVEILSPEDLASRVLSRTRDYLQMGIPAVWVVDPESRTVQVCRVDGTREVAAGSLTVPETSAVLSLAEIFGGLERR